VTKTKLYTTLLQYIERLKRWDGGVIVAGGFKVIDKER